MAACRTIVRTAATVSRIPTGELADRPNMTWVSLICPIGKEFPASRPWPDGFPTGKVCISRSSHGRRDPTGEDLEKNRMMGRSLFDTEDSELVIGLVAPIGCDRKSIHAVLDEIFSVRRYDVNRIKLSDVLPDLATVLNVELVDRPYEDRVQSYMTAGTALRKNTARGDVLALCAIHQISSERPSIDAVEPQSPKLSRRVHVLDSLKHPDEVRVLRQTYGPGFYLIGAFAPRRARKDYLERTIRVSEQQAELILNRDEQEENQGDFGQRTRDTFHLADVFVDVGDIRNTRAQLGRFFDLVFGDPFRTPTVDEFGMQAAASAACRSGALARQIGAAIVGKYGELISVGHNDVPSAGGGLYREGSKYDGRDLERGFDTNTIRIREIATDAAAALVAAGVATDAERAADVLMTSKLKRVTEYGRTVHAEMEAILAAARIGVSVRDSTLYTTTFPCHNCAKHAVAAGVSKILYVEPYPKSEALLLHEDSITHEGEGGGGNDGEARKVLLAPFLGVAPRRYSDLFAIVRPDGTEIERKGKDGTKRSLPLPQDSHPRSPMVPIAYPDRELKAVAVLKEISQKLGVESDDQDHAAR